MRAPLPPCRLIVADGSSQKSLSYSLLIRRSPTVHRVRLPQAAGPEYPLHRTLTWSCVPPHGDRRNLPTLLNLSGPRPGKWIDKFDAV